MGRLVGRLRALQVQRAKRGKLHDGGGLYLSCHRDGSKSWVFRYGAQGKRHCGLGPLHTITLMEARERARKCRQLLLDGCVGTILCRAATVRCSAYPGPSAWLGIRLARSTSIWFCARSRVGRRIRSWRALQAVPSTLQGRRQHRSARRAQLLCPIRVQPASVGRHSRR